MVKCLPCTSISMLLVRQIRQVQQAQGCQTHLSSSLLGNTATTKASCKPADTTALLRTGRHMGLQVDYKYRSKVVSLPSKADCRLSFLVRDRKLAYTPHGRRQCLELYFYCLCLEHLSYMMLLQQRTPLCLVNNIDALQYACKLCASQQNKLPETMTNL